MAELTARGAKAQRTTAAIPAFEWLTPLPPATRLIFHGAAAAREAAARVFQAPFSELACRACVQGARASLWLGPDEYLLLAPATDPADGLLAAMEPALAGVAHALVDISQRQIALEVYGPHATDLLNGACPLDLDIREFPVGACTRTVFAKADIVLWRTGATVFRLEVWRSFSAYVAALLAEIARDYYPSVTTVRLPETFAMRGCVITTLNGHSIGSRCIGT